MICCSAAAAIRWLLRRSSFRAVIASRPYTLPNSAAAPSATAQSISSRPVSSPSATTAAVINCSSAVSATTVRPIWVVVPVITAALLRCTCTP
nr:hypothetical protein [Cyanobium sp. Aljojuca 7D2]